jgi:RNA polymerase sigma factor (sigma-70 family)
MPRYKAKDDEAAWIAYKRHGTDACRNAILEMYWPDAVALTKTYIKPTMYRYLDELLSLVAERMLRRAIPRFDVGRGIPFACFLRGCIRRVIQEAFRSIPGSSAPNPSRAGSRRAMRNDMASKSLAQRLGRTPLASEIEDAGYSMAAPLPVGIPIEDYNIPAKSDTANTVEEDEIWDAAIAPLSDTQRQTLELRLHGYSMGNIATILGVSQSAISGRLRTIRKNPKIRHTETLLRGLL